MDGIYLLIFLFLFRVSPGGTYETYCSRGERVHTPREGHDVCLLCEHGTFMEQEHHFSKHCTRCKVIENPDVEVLVSACNSTHDAEILCTDGFYRRRARNVRQEDRCEKCTECLFPARPCGGYYDTVCCPPNYDAVMTPDGVFVCKERPIVCGPGQFFRTSSEECLPCPAGTFMSAHNHTYKECLKCEELSENNLNQAVIIRLCSRTAPTLFGCKAGYFRDPTQESLQIEVPCTPCRTCYRNLTDCGMFHDAVCNDEDRVVSDAATHNAVSSGLTDDTESRARGTPVPTDTLHNHERNEGNHTQNGVAECQTSLPSDVPVFIVVFVTLITILIVAVVSFICTDKPDTKHVYKNAKYNRFTTPRIGITIVVFVLLAVLLIISALLATRTIEATRGASTAFVITTVLATGVYIIAAFDITRRAQKRQVNQDRRPQWEPVKEQTLTGTAADAQRDELDRISTKLIPTLRDTKESQEQPDNTLYPAVLIFD